MAAEYSTPSQSAPAGIQQRQINWPHDCLGLYHVKNALPGVTEIYDFGIFNRPSNSGDESENLTISEVKCHWRHQEKINGDKQQGEVIFDVNSSKDIVLSKRAESGEAFMGSHLSFYLERQQENWDGINVVLKSQDAPNLNLIRVPVLGEYVSSGGHNVEVYCDEDNEIMIKTDGYEDEESELDADYDEDTFVFRADEEFDSIYLEKNNAGSRCYIEKCTDGNLLIEMRIGGDKYYDIWTRKSEEIAGGANVTARKRVANTGGANFTALEDNQEGMRGCALCLGFIESRECMYLKCTQIAAETEL